MTSRWSAALKLVLRTGVGVLWLSGAPGAEAQADKAQLGRRADTSVVDPALGTQH